MQFNSYEYDVAISLCKQDIEFARELVKALNPSLKIFFYENQQEELITKSGPEAFAKVFKEKSRIVVILSRDEWSESFYTEVEKNAIVDRVSNNKQGYNFLIVIPMETNQIPSWYPTTKIYANPKAFSIELLAKFIEFKITDEGGSITPITSEDYAEIFVNELKRKQETTLLQRNPEAINYVVNEVIKLKELFNSKIEYFSKNHYQFIHRNNLFNIYKNEAQIGISNFLVVCEIQDFDYTYQLVNTQQVKLIFTLYNLKRNSEHEIIETKLYRFYYSQELKGWSEPITYSGNNSVYINHLFTDYGNIWYDLKNPKSTEELIDEWITELWRHVKKAFDELL